MSIECPRDATELNVERRFGVQVDRCPTCRGFWLDQGELDEVEASTGASDAERRATITYAEHPSRLKCPVCSKSMTAFNYRAYNLELEKFGNEHGFWLDAGEGGRVRDIIEERVRDLDRSASAEASWQGFLRGLRR